MTICCRSFEFQLQENIKAMCMQYSWNLKKKKAKEIYMKPGKRCALFLFNTTNKKYKNFIITIVTDAYSMLTIHCYEEHWMKTSKTGSMELINGSSCFCERSELLLFTTLDLCHGSVTLTLHRSYIPPSVCNGVCMGFHFLWTLTYCRFTIYNIDIHTFSYSSIHVQTHVRTQTQ